ncbi:hypothetical protein ACQ4PT_017202 [Festuca glaucescens]
MATRMWMETKGTRARHETRLTRQERMLARSAEGAAVASSDEMLLMRCGCRDHVPERTCETQFALPYRQGKGGLVVSPIGPRVRRVGDCFLATNDIDDYMGMRAVCHNWRSATDDPRRPSGVGTDLLRFRPRRLVMLEEQPKDDGNDTRLFVNVTTGRFLRRRLPLLRDYILVATSDGLLVLGQSKFPFPMRVLNPFTGSMIHFVTSMPCDRAMAAVTGSDPALVFSFDVRHGEKVCCVNPASTLFGAQHFPRGKSKVASIVAYAGHVYMVDKEGLVVKSNDLKTGCV